MSRLPSAPNVAGVARDAVIAGRAERAAQHTSPQQRPMTPPLSRQNSNASHSSSGSSHSSHSSHQERQREQYLGEAQGGPPSVARGIAAAIAILLYLFAGQASGLWLFTRGFLLTRTTLEGTSACHKAAKETWSLPQPTVQAVETQHDYKQWENALISNAECSFPATYKRTFLWIIDALRYDYISDARVANESGWSPSPYHHNILDLPAKLDKDPTAFSILSHFQADAPTTTLQRLKGLTTGSLPTFIDAGSNFGGSEISEDNWLSQLRAQSPASEHANMAMAGDDTWLTVFPNVFDRDWRFPFDSFNVEDLDGVDHGVAKEVESFLDGSNATRANWRLFVAHTLGVDHVGHRLGASHPRMRDKLLEMQAFLDSLLKRLPEDALFVLMGDHGMDDNGDHGGDGELEVGAALWMYARKGKNAQGLPRQDVEYIQQASEQLMPMHRKFSPLPSPPFASKGHRSIAQIDFVPTISLLLGLPIPFNNLGSVIPEAFDSTGRYLRALRINAMQIKTYLDAYAHSSPDLKPFEAELSLAWQDAVRKDFVVAQAQKGSRFRQKSSDSSELDAARAYLYFNRLALARASSVWAKFEFIKIGLGVAVLALNLLAIVSIKRSANDANVEQAMANIFKASQRGAALGGVVALFGKLVSSYVILLPMMRALSLSESAFAGILIGAQVSFLATSRMGSASMADWSWIGASLPLIHATLFSSNSFTIHEDKVTLALASGTLLYRAVQGYVSSPVVRFKTRIPYFAVLACISLRLAGYSRVCREEHGVDCQTTFYTAFPSTIIAVSTMAFSYLIGLGLPSLVGRALSASRSRAGIAPLFLSWILRPALLFGSGYWLIDYILTSPTFEIQDKSAGRAALDLAKVTLARIDICLIAIIGLAIWIFSPLCLDLAQEPSEESSSGVPGAPSKQKVVILGFANSFGSSYILFAMLIFAFQFLLAQTTGQIALGLVMGCIVMLLELGDAERDVAMLESIVKDAPAARGDPHTQISNRAKSANIAAAASRNDADALSSVAMPVSMLETSTLALVGFVAFFATGHQATFVSIQWRTAFVGFRTLQYPFAPIFVIMNSFGPLALLPAVMVPLLVLWNLAPKPRKGPAAANAAPSSSAKRDQRTDGKTDSVDQDGRMPTTMHILQASLSFILYFTIVTFATVVFATHFRRHLMLFKIWTPRFMLSAASLQLVYVGLVIGLLAAGNVMSKVSVTFGSHL